ncbi:hypothetical protein [uncultured Psychrobacillus sp.]|uniref:hypothetical protein n=1 Tax=uncultured Psychrobacillus sp. TaxID=1551585 RepID=UPI002616414B|nr:hypothetical protein [uncultured Psychrobacillus sp.]
MILCSTILEESKRNAFYHRSQVFITAREAFITVPGKNITGSMNSDAQIPLIYPGDPSQVQ